MERWPISRSWLIQDERKDRTEVHTRGLARFPACCMLGSAGLGKTFELRHLAEFERARGLNVNYHRLATLAVSADGLASRLAAIAKDSAENSAIYLDALDEAMVPLRTTSLTVATWIRDHLTDTRIRLRISCRSAVWPSEVQAAVTDAYGRDGTRTATLTALSDDDVREVATKCGLSGSKFLREIRDTGVSTLAQQPLTLEMLVRVFQAEGKLPPSRRELFQKGTRLLLRERKERREAGTAPDIPLDEMTKAAERLACYTLLSGREVIDLSDNPTRDALDWLDLSSLPDGQGLDDKLLRALAASGLCDGEETDRFRFAHRQFAEYLAGRRIAKLLPHQAMSLLASGLGWRAGIAGPLRETAAFTAMESSAIASWIAEYDPEVIGLSDVADDSLRRHGMLKLLERFRRHELTDAQVSRDELRLAGFRYPGAEKDLGPVLRERGPDAEDVLECAVELAESWRLQSLSDSLADLALDTTAPMHPRRSAGYALARFGTREARRRLRPLLEYSEGDPEYDLKGLALRCLWPDELTVPELFAAMTPRREDAHVGAYDSFFLELDRSGFDAESHLMDGLKWARQHIRQHGNHDPAVRIAKRIAHRAVKELPDAAVAGALADLLLDCGKVYADSPLTPMGDDYYGSKRKDKPNEPAPLLGQLAARRAMIDAAVSKGTDQTVLWWAMHHTPGLATLEDFPWLIERSMDADRPMAERKQYAELMRMLHWYDDQPSVEAWLAVRQEEPVASTIGFPLQIELDSEEAAKARKYHADMKRWSKSPRRKRVKPSPAQRVRQALELSETKDPQFFFNLSSELTLEEFSTHYGFARHLTDTPGWSAASDETRSRIVKAAKRFLTGRTDEPERVRGEPLSTILPGYMPAILLITEVERSWLEAQPDDWWRRWAWYILRELHPHMSDERQEPKVLLLEQLFRRARAEVRDAVVGLAKDTRAGARHVLDAILELLLDFPDAELDLQLRTLLETGTVGVDHVAAVAEFILARDAELSVPACVSNLTKPAVGPPEEITVRLAIALLTQRTSESWEPVFAFLDARRDVAPRILAEFAHTERLAFRHDRAQAWIGSLNVTQIGQLLELLIELFPYESDPKRASTMMRAVQPDDSARDLRRELMNWLTSQSTGEAVLVLQQLERKYGTRYSWLRRPRAMAERAYRLSRWGPVPPASVAALLHANSKRLIRSGMDAQDGIVSALELYGAELRGKRSEELEDFWNTPKKRSPTPKSEERVSGKICDFVRYYFRKYAVTADREVQIYRRKSPRKDDGAPGSEIDVLVRIPAMGSVTGDAIALPVEVKLSHNEEGRTGLRAQLVDRYMIEAGTSFGAFVVAWMQAPNLPVAYKPIWGDVAAAKAELQQQAEEVASTDGANVAVIVFDASMPTARKAGGSAKKSSAKVGKRLPQKRARKPGKNPAQKPASKPVRNPAKKTAKKRVKKSARRSGR